MAVGHVFLVIAERPGHLDLPVLHRGEGERQLVAAHPDEDRSAGPGQRPDPLGGGTGVARALQQHVRLEATRGDAGLGHVDGAGGTELAGEPQPVRVDVGDHDLGGAEGQGALRRDEAHGSGAGDEDAAAGGDPAPAVGPDPDGERLQQCCGVV